MILCILGPFGEPLEMIRGVGLDIVEVERIREALDRHGESFLDRVLTPAERAYCARFHDPGPPVAARFAAKEAVFKALGTGWSGGMRWTDVEVVRGETGPPRVELHGKARQAAGEGRIWLSLTHEKTVAAAMAVLEDLP